MNDIDSIADALLAAYANGPIPPLTATHPGLTAGDAYAIQLRQVDLRTKAGTGIIGFKVGLTSVAMQKQLGVDQPDYGHLFTDMLHAADAPIPTRAFLQPRAEPEIALVLAQPLRGPGLSVADVFAATAYALPAIEIIDSRISDWRIGLVDTIADNASGGGLVLGGTLTPIAGRDLSLLGCVLRQDGRIVHTGAGAAVLGSPLQAAAWLANTLGVPHRVATHPIHLLPRPSSAKRCTADTASCRMGRHHQGSMDPGAGPSTHVPDPCQTGQSR